MSLNNLELPAVVITELFASTLVDGGGKEIPTEKPGPLVAGEPSAPAVWKQLGDNRKNILVMVDYPNAVILPDEELGFLVKMLTACKLDLGDVAILNRHSLVQASSKEILNRFHSRTVFLFGIDPLSFGLPVNFPAYQVQSLASVTYLYAPALEAHHDDAVLKRKLWDSLKRIFGI